MKRQRTNNSCQQAAGRDRKISAHIVPMIESFPLSCSSHSFSLPFAIRRKNKRNCTGQPYLRSCRRKAADILRHLTMAATENFFVAENSLLFFQNVPLRDSPIAVKMLDVSRFEGKVCPRN
jgi:hypothetical protein